MRNYYPIFLDLTGVLCVVIGGGKVAERKIRGLLRGGAKVRAVSPVFTAGISALAQKGRIEIETRKYRSGDLDGAALAFVATDDPEVNIEIKDEAARNRVPVNVADSPELCTFVVPSTIQKGAIVVALSTSGLLPSLSKQLRLRITEQIGPDYPAYARQVGRFRRLVIETIADKAARREILDAVTSADISEVARMSMKEMKNRFLPADNIGAEQDEQHGKKQHVTNRTKHSRHTPDSA